MLKRFFLRKMPTIYALIFLGCLAVSMLVNHSVTVMVETAPVQNGQCIVIDAGHGGIDGGAISCTGIPESQLNLEIAFRLNDLMRFLGYQTKMLRNRDTSLHTGGTTIGAQKISDLKHRVQMVNEAIPALLISIHQNTFSDPKYSGAQVFHNKTTESHELAGMIQAAFTQTINIGSTRKSKVSQGVYLMQHVQCPAVLIECGFLTNPQEEAALRSEAYQKKLSCVIAASISQYHAALQ